MKHFRIKVCGITSLKDAQLVNELGSDMIGFVFSKKSPRNISLAKAKSMAEKLPPTLDKVGVFVEPAEKQLLAIIKQVNLDYVQLHGKISPTLIRVLHKSGIKIIRSFHVQNMNSYNEIYKSKADLIQLDNSNRDQTGGTGKKFDWGLKPPKKIANLMLSGGLNVNNLNEGLQIFQPLVVDVNSGVESRPGIKSAVKLKHFFKFCNNLRYGTKA